MRTGVGMPALALAFWLALPGSGPAQRVAEGYHYDAPTEARLGEVGAEAKLVNWVEQIRGGRTQELYFRNTSDQPIQITSYEFFECTNVIGVSCGEEIEGPRLEPGETIRLESIRQRNLEQRWSYRYQFQASFLSSAPDEAQVNEPDGAAEVPARRRTTGWVPQRYEYVDRVMPMLMRNHSVPGVAIALVEGPGVQWSAGYGVTRAGTDGPGSADGEDVRPGTVFRVGELAEPVIALALHRLSGVRAWNVESPVTTWAHESTIPEGLESVSAAELLAHAAPREDADFALLQHLVEMAEGHDLEVLVRAMVLEPHRLMRTHFAPPASSGMASGHDGSGQPLPPMPVDDADAAGSLFASASDYARFLVETSILGRRDPATWRRLVRPHGEIPGDPELSRGLGWILGTAEDGTPTAFVVGAAHGYTGLAVVDEVRKRGMVIFTNGDGGLALTEQALGFLDPWSHPIVKAYLEIYPEARE
ncbi:MAG: serine hydrolase domain-containing protein [Gemmatimonadota bacterium]